MKEAENEDGEGKRKVESLWVSFRKNSEFLTSFSRFSKFTINARATFTICSIDARQSQ